MSNNQTELNLTEINKKFYNWKITMNNPGNTILGFRDRMKWLVYQFERGHEEDTLHIQGAVGYKNQVRRQTVAKDFPNCWVEPIYGDPTSYINYCQKEDTRVSGPYIYGSLNERKGKGARTDIKTYTEKLKELGLKKFSEEYPEAILKFGNKINMLDNIFQGNKKKVIPFVIWICGGSGSYKSRLYNNWFHQQQATIVKDGCSTWFDKYEYQDCVVFDDFRADTLVLHSLLNVLDIYKISVPIKGSSPRQWNPKFIFISCPFYPRECFKNAVEENLLQLDRRIDHVIDTSDELKELLKYKSFEESYLMPEWIRKQARIEFLGDLEDQDWDFQIPDEWKDYFLREHKLYMNEIKREGKNTLEYEYFTIETAN